MKILILIGALALNAAAFAGTPVEKQVPVQKVFVPSGFDNNDTVEIVVTGYLPNLCHKSPASAVKVEDNVVEVEITSLYYHETNPFCAEMVVPFVEAVSLGLMEAGEYKIVVNGKKKEKLFIARTNVNAVDTFHYAAVEYIEKKPGSHKVVLKGYNPSDCFVLDEIDYFSNKKDTYSILPKMKQVSELCPMKMSPFNLEFEVPGDLEAGNILLHVRTLNGKSVNTIYSKPKK